MEINKTAEQKYLDYVRDNVALQKEKLDVFIGELEENILKRQTHLRENRSQIKMQDIPGYVQGINDMIEGYEKQKLARNVLISALDSPYFGKIVFDGSKHYVGKFGVQSQDGKEVIISDWRAPVSSLFYDYEPGPAKYVSPDGVVSGEISEKLQFKIEKGVVEYIINTSLTINDEVLQKALSENTTNNLKTIVATIQKKQNEVIRQGLSKTTVVQGVAGSGKTSIALHRIAFLLYNNRKNLSSSNILIFSPSKIFSSYISSILPELGEQNVKEICFDEIFKNEFGSVCNFETRTEQVERLLKNGFDSKINDYKNSMEFTEKLTKFLDEFFEQNFKTRAVTVSKMEFTAEQLQGYIEDRKVGSINDKIRYLANAIVALVSISKKMSDKGEQFLEISAYNTVMKMLRQKNIFKIYSSFLAKNKLPPFNQVYLAAEDACALLYIKNYIFGANSDESIKHVVVDEMQDYSATGLAIIKQMHSCPKTILGDFHQMVDGKFSEDKLHTIVKLFCSENSGTLLRLERNYRSTTENDEFARTLLGAECVEAPIRHGEKPTLMTVTREKEAKTILNLVDELVNKGHQSIGILCKNSEQAAELYSRIGTQGRSMNLILPKTEYFEKGIVVAAAHIVKGLEFDAVIIADASDENYKTEIDKQSLYIAATRALHKIYAIGVNNVTKFIKK